MDDGAEVRRGDLLVQLETDELRAALAQAQAKERQASRAWVNRAALQGADESGLGRTDSADCAGGQTLQTSVATDAACVAALIDLGVKDLNKRVVIVSLRSAHNPLGLPGGATSIDMKIKDVWAAEALAQSLRSQFPYKIESLQESNAQLLSALKAQSVSTALIRGVIMLVVLGIASALVVSFVQKQREIGILRAMDATRAQVLRLFFLQGAVVDALGSCWR